MTREEYNRLFEKYNLGQCTDEESKLVENYQDAFELSDQQWDSKSMGDQDSVRDALINELNYKIRRHDRARVLDFRKWIAAASIILMVFSAVLYFWPDEKPQLTVVPVKPAVVEDIAPGSNKAVLTLDDGSHINLDDAKNGLLAKESTTSIEKLQDGRLSYNAGQQATGTSARYNTISTPRGGQYQITLSDGSKVWLNAGSSIRFPTIFTGKERKVEIKGEAYFEIAKNARMPFKVSSNNSEIEVLGTHFNVMAYSDERSMNTTLLEGLVQISNGSGKQLLKPGQAVVMNNSTGNMKVVPADTEQATAWKNGYFIFKDENIESIMRKISRWYDVDVSYNGNMANKDFTGTISRNEKVSEVLKMLELTGAIHFNILAANAAGKGRRITVMP